MAFRHTVVFIFVCLAKKMYRKFFKNAFAKMGFIKVFDVSIIVGAERTSQMVSAIRIVQGNESTP